MLMRLAQSRICVLVISNISTTAVSRKKFSNWLILAIRHYWPGGDVPENMLCGFEEVAARTGRRSSPVATVNFPRGVMSLDNMSILG